MFISGVLFLSMLETMVYYLNYYEINAYGVVSPFLLSSGNFLSLMRKTAARLLVLVVSMGFGMIKYVAIKD